MEFAWYRRYMISDHCITCQWSVVHRLKKNNGTWVNLHCDKGYFAGSHFSCVHVCRRRIVWRSRCSVRMHISFAACCHATRLLFTSCSHWQSTTADHSTCCCCAVSCVVFICWMLCSSRNKVVSLCYHSRHFTYLSVPSVFWSSDIRICWLYDQLSHASPIVPNAVVWHSPTLNVPFVSHVCHSTSVSQVYFTDNCLCQKNTSFTCSVASFVVLQVSQWLTFCFLLALIIMPVLVDSYIFKVFHGW